MSRHSRYRSSFPRDFQLNPNLGKARSRMPGVKVPTSLGSTHTLQVPVEMKERGGVAAPILPITGGIPFPRGVLLRVPDMEWNGVAVEAERLAVWPDGSVKWLRMEMLAPALTANQRMTAVLQDRKSTTTITGSNTVTGPNPAVVSNGVFTLTESQTAEELFTLSGATAGNFSAAATYDINYDARDSEYNLVTKDVGASVIEHQNNLSVTIKRVDNYQDTGGRNVVRVTTRWTMWANTAYWKVTQSVDSLLDEITITKWDITFPITSPGTTTRVATSTSAETTETGDFDYVQANRTQYIVGTDTGNAGTLPGVIGATGFALGVKRFWQHFPAGLERSGNSYIFHVVDDDAGMATLSQNVLQRGQGHTVEFWMVAGATATAVDVSDLAAIFDKQPRLMRYPQQDHESAKAAGPIGLVVSGDHDTRETDIGTNITDIYTTDQVAADEYAYGFQNYGDHYQNDGTSIEFWGAVQHEYDPLYVTALQAIRTLDHDLLDYVEDYAKHYVNNDLSYYGGAFQHRATKDLAYRPAAQIMANSFEADLEADMTAEPTTYGPSPWTWDQYVDAMEFADVWGGAGVKSDVQEDMTEFRSWISTDDYWSRKTALMSAAWRLIDSWEGTAPSAAPPQDPGENLLHYNVKTLFTYMYVNGFASSLDANNWNGSDTYYPDGNQPTTQVGTDHYLGTFNKFGSDWDNFPTAHAGQHGRPRHLHEGSHHVGESIALAYFLTGGDKRMEERLLQYGEFCADAIVPREESILDGQLPYSAADFRGRRWGWNTLGLVAVWQMCHRFAGRQGTRAKIDAGILRTLTNLEKVAAWWIDGSIHAGVLMDALVKLHWNTGSARAWSLLSQIAPWWAGNQHDAAGSGGVAGAFFKKNQYPTLNADGNYGDISEGSALGYSGLVSLGLAYYARIANDATVRSVIETAWDGIDDASGSQVARVFGQLYRGYVWALPHMREIKA